MLFIIYNLKILQMMRSWMYFKWRQKAAIVCNEIPFLLFLNRAFSNFGSPRGPTVTIRAFFPLFGEYSHIRTLYLYKYIFKETSGAVTELHWWSLPMKYQPTAESRTADILLLGGTITFVIRKKNGLTLDCPRDTKGFVKLLSKCLLSRYGSVGRIWIKTWVGMEQLVRCRHWNSTPGLPFSFHRRFPRGII